MASNFLTKLEKAGARKEHKVEYPVRKKFKSTQPVWEDKEDYEIEQLQKSWEKEQQKLKKEFEKEQDSVERRTFIVRDMTGNMRDYFDAENKKRIKFRGKNPDYNTLRTEGQRALIVALTLVDEDTGNLAFDYTKKEDIEKIGELAGSLLDAITDVAVELCGINGSEETEKN